MRNDRLFRWNLRTVVLILFVSIATTLVSQNALSAGAGTLSPSAKLRAGEVEVSAQAGVGSGTSAASHSLRGSGMKFTENKGQIVDMKQQLRPDVLFKGDGGGADVYIRKTGVSYVLSNMGSVLYDLKQKEEELLAAGVITEDGIIQKREELMRGQLVKIHRLDVDFVNCLPAGQAGNPDAEIITADQVEGYSNFYYAHCANGITNVNSYNEVTVKNIYKNIDIKYYGGKEHGLKYDIIINPGGNPDEIQLKYSGAEGLEIKNEEPACRNGGQATAGRLIIKNSIGDIIEELPKVYQNINGKIVDVKMHYVLDGTTVSLKLDPDGYRDWNPLYPLVVDPWLSYYGGNNIDAGTSVTNDPFGNVLFTGVTQSVNFPVTAGAYQVTFAGTLVIAAFHDAQGDAFVVKMNANGNQLWATYYGGTNNEHGCGIATDPAGNVLVAGNTISTNLPVTAGCHQSVYGGNGFTGNGGDAFLLKLTGTGVMTWATYYGGYDGDYGKDVVSDGSNIYFYGSSLSTTVNSPNAISTAGAFQTANNGLCDVFVAKFNSAGNRLWGTYLGGAQWDICGGIAWDNFSGNIFIGGSTASANFPVSAGAQMIFGGSRDAFVCKLSPAGVRLWGTYYGGSSDDKGTCISVDNIGNIILAGFGQSTTSISTPGAYQLVFGGGTWDGFIVKFNSSGSLLWGTYLGGNTNEWLYGGVATDTNNNIYVYGEWEDTNGGNYPISSCAYQTTFGGGWVAQWVEDQFIARYDANGKQRCMTYIGGAGEDELDWSYGSWGGITGGGISVFGNSLYITGSTDGGYPVTPGAFQTTYAGTGNQATTYQTSNDAFIDQLCINLCEANTLGLSFTASAVNVCNSNPVTFTPAVNNSCDTSGYKFQWTFTGGNPSGSTSINPVVSYPVAGNYTVKLVLTTACKKDSVTSINYISVTSCGGPTVTANGSSVCPGGCTAVTSSGTGGTTPYTYLWSTGATTQNINPCPVSTTTYTVTITDTGGKTSTSTAVVTVNPAVSATTTATNITCSGTSTGSATVAGGGGTPGYSYLWSNLVSGSGVSGLASGTYTVTVTDSKGCSSVSTATIISPIPLTGQFTKGTAVCAGCSCKQWIMINAAGGTSPYSYTWPDGYVNRYKNQLCPGTYNVNIKDKNGCSINVNLTSP